MEYRRLGKSGLRVSEFSFGAWVTFAKQVGEDDAASIMGAAYDAGINFFDNAEGYEQGNAELVMGEALKKLGWTRDSYMVSSKVFWGGKKPTQRGLSAKHVTDGCHMALKRLQVDYLDLYFCHRPDIETPIEETVRAMHNLVQQGKVIYWGTSEWNAQQLTEAHLVARVHNHDPIVYPCQQFANVAVARVVTFEIPPFLSRALYLTIAGKFGGRFVSGAHCRKPAVAQLGPSQT